MSPPRSARRRITTLESALTPNGVVLRWLAEAKAHGSMTAYFDALAAGPGGLSPYERFLELLEPAFDPLVPPGSSPDVVRAGQLASRQAMFRFFLIARLNVHAVQRLPLLMATARTHSELLDALWAGQADAGQAASAVDPARDGRWQAWLARAEWLLGELYTDQLARWTIEASYLDGMGSLFPDLAERYSVALGLTEVTTKLGLVARPSVGPGALGGFNETALKHILATSVVQAGDLVTALVERAKSDFYAQCGRAMFDRRRQADAAPTPPAGESAARVRSIDRPPRGPLDRGGQRAKPTGLYERVEV